MTKLLLTTLSLLVVLTGCQSAQLPENSNQIGENTKTTNTVAENTNDTVNENANTNADGESDEVDTSDWLTYENEEYGFSVKYPKEWGNVEVERYSKDEYREGEKVVITFSNDGEMRSNNGYGAPSVSIETLDYKFIGPSDGQDIFFKDINFNLTNEKLVEGIKRYPNSELEITRSNILNRSALVIIEKYNYVDLYIQRLYYLIPNYNEHNIRVTSDLRMKKVMNGLVSSLKQI